MNVKFSKLGSNRYVKVDQTFLPRVILHGGESESGRHPPLSIISEDDMIITYLKMSQSVYSVSVLQPNGLTNF